MKTSHIFTIVCIAGGLLTFTIAEAQLLKKIGKSITKKVEDRFEKEADKAMDKILGEDTGVPGSGASDDPLRELPPTVYDFTPGTTVIFEDDFNNDAVGSMARKWRSNGSGTIAAAEHGGAEQWFQLTSGNIYRIANLEELPENFTVEFDLITRCEDADKIYGGSFGLTRDNQTSGDGWNQSIAAVGFGWWSGNPVKFSSESGDKKSLGFPMKNYARRTMRVEIQITNGNWMKVYFDKYKILDTDMMYADSPKYFYITAPKPDGKYDRTYIDNVRISAL